jgi:uncharacterized OB-fold protein
MTAGAIRLARCQDCGHRWKTCFPGCPYCGSSALEEIPVAATGCVYSWVEVHRSLEDPPAQVPYTVVAVDLDGGGRVLGRWCGSDTPRGEARVESTAGETPGAAIIFMPI